MAGCIRARAMRSSVTPSIAAIADWEKPLRRRAATRSARYAAMAVMYDVARGRSEAIEPD